MPNAPRALLLARRQRAVEPVVAAVDLARRAAPRPGRARCFDALPGCRSLPRDDVVELLDGRRLGRRRRIELLDGCALLGAFDAFAAARGAGVGAASRDALSGRFSQRITSSRPSLASN